MAKSWRVMLVLVALAIGLRLLPGPRIIDDAFITYRYARNIVRGLGFVYNPGEAVLGTTTPLYTLLLAGLAWITHSEAIPSISLIVNTLADGASTALLYLLAHRLLSSSTTDSPLPGSCLLPALLGLLWAVSPRGVATAISGMETSIYMLCLIGAYMAWLVGRGWLAAALAALGTFTRPDALIWAGPLALAMIVEKWQKHHNQPLLRRLPWAEAGIYLAILLPWLIYGTLTFGSPLPRSMTVKLVAYHRPWYTALMTLLVHYGISFSEQATLGTTAALVGCVIYPLLAISGGLWLFRTDRRAAPLVAFPWLYLVVFALANPLIFPWYLVPPMPFYFLCILAGAWTLLLKLTSALRAEVRWAKWAMAALGLVWAGFSLRAWNLHPGYGQDRPAPQVAWDEPVLLQGRIGRLLAPYVGGDVIVATGDIGAVGWYSDARILDTVGLVSPEASAYYPLAPEMLGAAGYAIAPDMIFDHMPDYIILLESYGENGLFKDPRFDLHYRLFKEFPIEAGHSRRVLIYERVNADR